MIAERRTHTRKVPAEFTYIQLEQEFGGRVLNYSKDGLCFETSSPISSSDLVQFWLSVRRHSHIDGVGRITWLSEKKNIGGIAFVHLSRTSRQRIDEWADAAPEDEAPNVGNNPEKEDISEHLVSQVMEQVLNERRSSPVVTPARAAHADGESATDTASKAQELECRQTTHLATSPAGAPPTSSAVNLPGTKAAPVTEPREPEASQASTQAAAPALAASPAKCVDPPDMNGATTDGPREWKLTEEHSPALSALDATSSEGIAFASERIEAVAIGTEQELQAAAVPEWLVHPSLPSTTPTPILETQVSSNPDSSPEELKELVPLKLYRYAQGSQFIRGAAIGILLSAVIAIFLFKFRPANQPGALAEGTRDAVSVNPNIAKADTIPAQSAPTSYVGSVGLTQESKGPASPPKRQNVTRPSRSPVARAGLAALNEPPQDSAPLAAPASVQESLDAPTNAVPRPDSFANRNSSAGSGSQPLFQLAQPSQPNSPDAPTADAVPWNGQSKVQVELGSTPWTFRRRNIHGTPPVGGDVRPAELIGQVTPRYPESAKAQHLSGDVVIDIIVDARGNVRHPAVVSGPMAFRSAAVNAVLSWKYKPALVDGKPTESHATITLKFRDD